MKDTTKKKIVKWFWIVFASGVAAVVLLLAAVWAFADIPSFEDLENPDSKLATQVIAEDGEILTTFHIENRSYVSYDELSPNLVHAAVATEDSRFYRHSGIDFESLGRVLVKTVLGGSSSQGGGSTITQQLAKTLYPREDVSSRIPGVSTLKMVWIKLKEWVTAVKLERSYTKDEIMNMYMNQIFFGSNAYGIKADARGHGEQADTLQSCAEPGQVPRAKESRDLPHGAERIHNEGGMRFDTADPDNIELSDTGSQRRRRTLFQGHAPPHHECEGA